MAKRGSSGDQNTSLLGHAGEYKADAIFVEIEAFIQQKSTSRLLILDSVNFFLGNCILTRFNDRNEEVFLDSGAWSQNLRRVRMRSLTKNTVSISKSCSTTIISYAWFCHLFVFLTLCTNPIYSTSRLLPISPLSTTSNTTPS